MPILGVIASQISGHLFAPSGAWDSIATANGTGSSGVITFSSIPSTYTHLQIRNIGRGTGAGTTIKITANSDTAANYARHYMYGDGATAGAGNSTSQTGADIAYTSLSTDLSNTYAVNIIDILDYANTSKYKTFRVLTGLDVNGSGGYAQLTSGLWQSTSAITTLTLTLNAGSYTTASQFALYGIRGN